MDSHERKRGAPTYHRLRTSFEMGLDNLYNHFVTSDMTVEALWFASIRQVKSAEGSFVDAHAYFRTYRDDIEMKRVFRKANTAAVRAGERLNLPTTFDTLIIIPAPGNHRCTPWTYLKQHAQPGRVFYNSQGHIYHIQCSPPGVS